MAGNLSGAALLACWPRQPISQNAAFSLTMIKYAQLNQILLKFGFLVLSAANKSNYWRVHVHLPNSRGRSQSFQSVYFQGIFFIAKLQNN